MTEFIVSHWLDITTTLLGLAYILLELKASIWMWVVGFVMQALGIVLYYQRGLYADCGMEFYYLAMTVYGFTRWVRPTSSGTQKQTARCIRSFFASERNGRVGLAMAGVFLVAWAAIYVLLVSFTNSTVPIADSFTTALSIVGIWALAHKYLEQWFVWIAVDVVTCVLYFHKDIPFKASLYGLYVVIAVWGWFRWRAIYQAQDTDDAKV